MGAVKPSCLPCYLQEPDSHLGKGQRPSDAGHLPEAASRLQQLDLGTAEAAAHSTASLNGEQQAASADQAASSQAAEARHTYRAAGAAALPLHTEPKPDVTAADSFSGQHHQQDHVAEAQPLLAFPHTQPQSPAPLRQPSRAHSAVPFMLLQPQQGLSPLCSVQVADDAAPAHLEGQAPVEPSRTAGGLQLPAFTTRPLQEGLLAGRHLTPAALRGMGPLEAGAALSKPAEASIRHAAAPQSTSRQNPQPGAVAAESMELGADAGSSASVPGDEADEPTAVPGSRLLDVPEHLLGEPARSNRPRPASAGTRPAAADLRPRSNRPSSASVTADGGSRAGLMHSMSAFQVSPGSLALLTL